MLSKVICLFIHTSDEYANIQLQIDKIVAKVIQVAKAEFDVDDEVKILTRRNKEVTSLG